MMYIKSSIWSVFEIKNWIEDKFQSSPKLVGIWTVLKWSFVTSIGGKLWHAKAQNGVNFDFGVQFHLEGHDQSSPPKNRDLNDILPKFGDPGWNGWWVITRTISWLTHGRTHTQTDAGNDNTRRPKPASGNKTMGKSVKFTASAILLSCMQTMLKTEEKYCSWCSWWISIVFCLWQGSLLWC